jgi:hypothetical protein
MYQYYEIISHAIRHIQQKAQLMIIARNIVSHCTNNETKLQLICALSNKKIVDSLGAVGFVIKFREAMFHDMQRTNEFALTSFECMTHFNKIVAMQQRSF